MTRPVPKNLELLYDGFGEDAISAILPGDHFTIDGVEFVCSYEPESTADRFYIVKSMRLVERYLELAERFRGGRIVELGIAEGGSTALLALVAEPEVLVAVDLEDEPLAALDEFIERRDLGRSVLPRWGVDQADRAGLAATVDAALDGEPIDLVIDDCSHKLGPTRVSLETLFPRLRPGGLYVIEDWNADHAWKQAMADSIRREVAAGNTEILAAFAQPAGEPAPRVEPLYQLAIELMLARAGSGDLVDEVVVDEFWITARRGPGVVDPDAFRLDDAYEDHFGVKGW